MLLLFYLVTWVIILVVFFGTPRVRDSFRLYIFRHIFARSLSGTTGAYIIAYNCFGGSLLTLF